jgi:tetratricopeptide (TPR) repeat protein
MELERFEAALACFERAIVLVGEAPAPAQAVYWLTMGKALYLLGRPGEALDALQHSHSLDPSAESAAGIAACRERLAA